MDEKVKILYLLKEFKVYMGLVYVRAYDWTDFEYHSLPILSVISPEIVYEPNISEIQLMSNLVVNYMSVKTANRIYYVESK